MAMRGVAQLRMAVKSGTHAKSITREEKATRAAVVVGWGPYFRWVVLRAVRGPMIWGWKLRAMPVKTAEIATAIKAGRNRKFTALSRATM